MPSLLRAVTYVFALASCLLLLTAASTGRGSGSTRAQRFLHEPITSSAFQPHSL
jgi:hypothetical protein